MPNPTSEIPQKQPPPGGDATMMLTAGEQIALQTQCLFSPQDIIEVRRLPSRRSTWHRADELAAIVDTLNRENLDGENVYIGANPAQDDWWHHGRRRGLWPDACGLTSTRSPWMRPASASAAGSGLRCSSCPGTACTAIGGSPNRSSTWQAGRSFRKTSSRCLKSDPAIHDPPRIMRLAGFVNHKAPAANCTIVESDPSRVYDLCDLAELLPHVEEPIPATPGGSDDGRAHDGELEKLARATAWLTKRDGAVEGQGGDAHTFTTAANLVMDFGLSVDQAWP